MIIYVSARNLYFLAMNGRIIIKSFLKSAMQMNVMACKDTMATIVQCCLNLIHKDTNKKHISVCDVFLAVARLCWIFICIDVQ